MGRNAKGRRKILPRSPPGVPLRLLSYLAMHPIYHLSTKYGYTFYGHRQTHLPPHSGPRLPAAEIIRAVQAAVSQWESIAEKVGIYKAERNAMAKAFKSASKG